MPTFSHLSLGFLGSVAAAIVLLGITRGRVRALIFLSLNIWVVLRYLLGPRGTITMVVFALVGFGIVELSRRGHRRVLLLGGAALVGMFVYMQDYEILHHVLPDTVLTRFFTTIGASFLFFKILHCLIEAHSGTLGSFSFLTYLNYALGFHTFAMGPIQRYPDFRDQWSGKKDAIPHTFEAHLDAVIRLLFGLVKAYVLAELVYPYAMRPGMDLASASRVDLLVSVYAFNVYLYLNFAGYCDVAIGFGSLIGVRPPENFNLPFIARNVSDFWQRQHRSLTTWLTDYVFTPTFKRLLEDPRFRKRSLLSANIALLVTMFVSGVWHGTSLGFVVFGLLHGLYQVIYRSWDVALTKLWGKKKVRAWRKQKWVHATGILLTFNAVSFAFVFFQLNPTEGFALLWRLVS